MRNQALVLFTTATVLALSLPAMAQEEFSSIAEKSPWSADLNFESHLLDQNFEPLSKKASAEANLSYNFTNHFGVYVYGAGILSTNGRYGIESFGDQAEGGAYASGSYAGTDYEAEAGLNHSIAHGKLADDTFRMQIQLSHNFTLGNTDVKVYGQGIYWLALRSSDPDTPIGIIGVTPTYKINDNWKVGADFAGAYDGNEKVARVHVMIPTISYEIGSWTMNASTGYLIGHDTREKKESGSEFKIGIAYKF